MVGVAVCRWSVWGIDADRAEREEVEMRRR
jgi:hypothetical protein